MQVEEKEGAGMEEIKIHELKILPKYYQAVLECRKNFEVRKNDRDFKIGDELYLKEWDGEKYTGRSIYRTITYILKDSNYVKDDYVILSIK